MRNISDKSVGEIKTHNPLVSITFSPENRAVCEIMWKKYGRAAEATNGNISRRMRIACCILKATNTHHM